MKHIKFGANRKSLILVFKFILQATILTVKFVLPSCKFVFLVMLEQFLNHLSRFELCQKTDTILLAVSGGVDSMTMVHLFKKAGYHFSVAHCNFQLRGKESDDDELFVKEVCQKLQIPFYTRRFETESFAWEQGLSIQMAARDLRYTWFNELMKFHGYNLLATG